MFKYVFTSLVLLISSCYPTTTDSYKIVYKNDKSGNSLMGSKQNLIQAIRSGSDIKIGWGHKGKTHQIEHLSEPIWLAVLDETEVLAHLDPQVFSSLDWDSLSTAYSDSTKLAEEWRVVLTTKGTFDAVWLDRNSNQVIQRRPQQHTMTWFAKGGNENALPLFKE